MTIYYTQKDFYDNGDQYITSFQPVSKSRLVPHHPSADSTPTPLPIELPDTNNIQGFSHDSWQSYYE